MILIILFFSGFLIELGIIIYKQKILEDYKKVFLK